MRIKSIFKIFKRKNKNTENLTQKSEQEILLDKRKECEGLFIDIRQIILNKKKHYNLPNLYFFMKKETNEYNCVHHTHNIHKPHDNEQYFIFLIDNNRISLKKKDKILVDYNITRNNLITINRDFLKLHTADELIKLLTTIKETLNNLIQEHSENIF